MAEEKKEILTEKLEQLLNMIDDFRPELCDGHYGMSMMGLNMFFSSISGEVKLTKEQEHCLDNFFTRNHAAQDKLSKEEKSHKTYSDTPDPRQFYKNAYGNIENEDNLPF